MSDFEERQMKSSVRTRLVPNGSTEVAIWRKRPDSAESAVFDAVDRKNEMWFEVMSTLTRAVQLEELYEAAFDSVEKAVGCRRAAILAMKGSEGPDVSAWRGLDANFREQLPKGRKVRDAGRFPRLVEVGEIGERLNQRGRDMGDPECRWSSVVSLTYRGEEEGLLVLFFSSRRIFDEEERRVVELVATHLAMGLERMRSEERIRLLHEELQRKEEEFEALLDTVPVGIGFTEDPDAANIWGNQAFAKILGCKGLKNVSKSNPSLDLPFRVFKDGVEAAPEDLPMQRACREKREVLDEELTIVRGDGSEVVELCRAKPLLDAHGNVRGCISIFLDITHQKRVLEALRQSESRFRLLAESLPHAVWTAKSDGEIDYYNGRWSRFPKAETNPEHWDWLELVHPEDADACRDSWRKCVKSGENFEAEFRLRDGKTDRWYLGRAIPLRDESGAVVRWIGSCTDIDEQKRAEEYLENAVSERTRELRETNDQLEEFVYSIAHDLRAPLRSMQAFSTMLLAENGHQLNEDGKNFARRIVTSAETMDTLVLDLLAYGRMARTEMVLGPVKVADVWVAAQAQHERNILESGALVETIGPLPKVAGHEATIGQVLANLLGNALKFVAPDVKPHVRLWADVEAGNVRLWVEDNGIGIAPEYKDRIFRIFERLEPGNFGGTGIGLSIVRKGVERMGGRVGLVSEAGKGSKFWIELPEA